MLKEACIRVVDGIQNRYDQYRPQELHGTPQTSVPFLNSLRKGKILEGTKDFIKAHETLGRKDWSPSFKAFVSIAGSLIQCTGLPDAVKSKNPWINTTAQAILSVNSALLMAAHGNDDQARKYSAVKHATGWSVESGKGFMTADEVEALTGTNPEK